MFFDDQAFDKRIDLVKIICVCTKGDSSWKLREINRTM